MKRYIMDFLRRGMIAAGVGPLVLAILYLILKRQGIVELLRAEDVSRGILSLLILAFIAGGMNAVYQIEQIPLMVAIFLHGSVLYVTYLGTYLVNDWLDFGIIPLAVFTGIFAVGYLTIWAVIYCVIRRNTDKVNKILKDIRNGEK